MDSPWLNATMNEQWKKLKKERNTRIRSQCVWRNIKRLRDEGKIILSNLKVFLQLKNEIKSKEMLNRDAQIEIAHLLTIDMMAYNLHRAFKIDLNEKTKAVFKKSFIWFCEETVRTQLTRENRLIIREEVETVRNSLWEIVNNKNAKYN